MRNSWLLDWLVILTLLSVALGGVGQMPTPQLKILSMVILILVGLILILYPFRKSDNELRNQICMAVLCALISSLILISPGWTPYPITFFVLAAYATVSFPIRKGLLWIAIFILITIEINIWMRGVEGLISSFPYITGYLFFGIFGFLMVQADEARKRSEELLIELQKAHQQLQDYANQVEELTVERERNHLAREVHDTLGHQLTVSVVQLEGAQRLVSSDPSRASAIIATVRDQLKTGLRDLRLIVATLRAPQEEDAPLLSSIQKLSAHFQEATGIMVQLNIPNWLPSIPNPTKQTIYRTLQEGLTNIQKHAHATGVEISMQVQDKNLIFKLMDNGVGLQSETKGGFGLMGLKERAAFLDGSFEVSSPNGGGTLLSLCVPLADEVNNGKS